MPGVISSILPNTDTAVIPSGYKIISIDLTNHRGRTIDIQSIITEFSITESIYQMCLTASFSIKDTVNFIEEFELVGYERISVNLSRTEPGNIRKKINLVFYAVEYPLYMRGQQNTQAYKISGITEIGYNSKLSSISRSVSGISTNSIRKIIEEDLKRKPGLTLAGTVTSNFTCVLPNMNPLDGAAFLLRRTHDSNKAPCFLYETIDNNINLSTYTSMITGAPIGKYSKGTLFTGEPGSVEEYKERQYRVLDVVSDPRLSKVIPATLGAFASVTESLDLTTKTYKKRVFNYKNDGKSTSNINGKSLLSSVSQDLSLTSNVASHYIPTSSSSYTKGQSYNESGEVAFGIMNSYITNMDSVVHDISIYGDFAFNPGKLIELSIPKAVEYSSIDDSALYDKLMSGKYLITAVIHKFSTEYFIEARVKSDSLNISL